LLAGDVARVVPRPEPRAVMMDMVAPAAKFGVAGGAPSEQGFSEYHLYTLPGVVTLRDRESQTLVLIEPHAVAVKPLYVYRGGNPSGVQAQLEMTNTAKSGVGTPIPAGRVRTYAPDADKELQLTGEATVRHTAVDETLTLDMGYAF